MHQIAALVLMKFCDCYCRSESMNCQMQQTQDPNIGIASASVISTFWSKKGVQYKSQPSFMPAICFTAKNVLLVLQALSARSNAPEWTWS